MTPSIPPAHRAPARVPPGWQALALGLALAATGCRTASPEPPLQRFAYAELHMGSVFRLVLFAPDRAAADQAAEAAFRRVAEIDACLSDYNPQSELRRLSELPAGRPVPVSPLLYDVLDRAQEIARRSGGAFDPTLGPVIKLWRRARQTQVLPSPAERSAAQAQTGYRQLDLDPRQRTVTLQIPGMQLDLGGIAKGYAADEVLAVLGRLGLRRAMAAASGDIALGDPPPGQDGWLIDIESLDAAAGHPPSQVRLSRAGISTSGDTEQYVEIGGQRYSHIVDPETGLGLTHRIGVTIIAPTATLSDGLATAASVLGSQRGLALVKSFPGASARIVEATPETGYRVVASSKSQLIADTRLDPAPSPVVRAQKLTLTNAGSLPAAVPLAHHLATNAAGRARGLAATYAGLCELSGWRPATYAGADLAWLTRAVWSTNFWLKNARGLSATSIGFRQRYAGQGLVTLVSPRHCLFATHMHSEQDHFVAAFLDTNNVVHWRTNVESVHLGMDTSVGILDADLPSAVGFLPVLPTNFSSYLPTNAASVVQGLGMNQDLSVFSQPLNLERPTLVTWNGSHPIPLGLGTNWSVALRGGDSSAPVRLLVGDQLVLVSHNWGGVLGPNYTFKFDAINQAMHRLSTNLHLRTDYQLTPFSLANWPVLR